MLLSLGRHTWPEFPANPPKQWERSSIFSQCQCHEAGDCLEGAVMWILLLSPRQWAITSAQTEQVWWVCSPQWDPFNAMAEM